MTCYSVDSCTRLEFVPLLLARIVYAQQNSLRTRTSMNETIDQAAFFVLHYDNTV